MNKVSVFSEAYLEPSRTSAMKLLNNALLLQTPFQPLVLLKYFTYPKGRIHCEIFSFRAFHEIQFQGHFIAWNTFKHEILSWNSFTLAFKFYCVRFSSIKKLCLQLERYRVKFNSTNKYLLLIKQKQKNSKIPKRIWMKPCSKTRGGKSVSANIFLELSLTI